MTTFHNVILKLSFFQTKHKSRHNESRAFQKIRLLIWQHSENIKTNFMFKIRSKARLNLLKFYPRSKYLRGILVFNGIYMSYWLLHDPNRRQITRNVKTNLQVTTVRLLCFRFNISIYQMLALYVGEVRMIILVCVEKCFTIAPIPLDIHNSHI